MGIASHSEGSPSECRGSDLGDGAEWEWDRLRHLTEPAASGVRPRTGICPPLPQDKPLLYIWRMVSMCLACVGRPWLSFQVLGD